MMPVFSLLSAGHTKRPTCCAITPTGTIAVSGDKAGAAILWDVQSLTSLHVLEGHTGAVLSTSINSQVCCTTSKDNTARLWALSTGACMHVLLAGSPVLASSLSPADGLLVVCTKALVSVWKWPELPRTAAAFSDVEGAPPASPIVVFKAGTFNSREFPLTGVSISSNPPHIVVRSCVFC